MKQMEKEAEHAPNQVGKRLRVRCRWRRRSTRSGTSLRVWRTAQLLGRPHEGRHQALAICSLPPARARLLTFRAVGLTCQRSGRHRLVEAC